jgi:integrase
MSGLTVLGVKNARPGRHADGDGLYLLVKPTGARSWLLRVQVDGRRRDIGLGSVDLVGKRDPAEAGLPILHRRKLTLLEAREKAGILSRIAKAGRDPISERDKERAAIPTFKEAAEKCHGDLKSGWAPKNAAGFLASLKEHAFPALGKIPVDQVEASQIRDMLAPIWNDIPVMARKVRQRVGIVLNYSKAKGWRASEAPGKSVTMGLARGHRGGNFAAMPYADVPDFLAELEGKTITVGRLALRFVILTAARSGEVRNARWDQIDFDKKLWNRPSTIMKNKIAHVVTLSDAAIALLREAEKVRTSARPDALIFPNTKGKALSDMTLSKVMRDADKPYTVHGFRSSFRDFAAEQMPTIPDPVAEAALAHLVPDKVVRAYKRASFLDMRRKLLDGWAGFLAGQQNVLKLAASNG